MEAMVAAKKATLKLKQKPPSLWMYMVFVWLQLRVVLSAFIEFFLYTYVHADFESEKMLNNSCD